MRNVWCQGYVCHQQQSAKDEREDPHVQVPAPEVLLRVADEILDSKETTRVRPVRRRPCFSLTTPHKGLSAGRNAPLIPSWVPGSLDTDPCGGRFYNEFLPVGAVEVKPPLERMRRHTVEVRNGLERDERLKPFTAR